MAGTRYLGVTGKTGGPELAPGESQDNCSTGQ
jgi:hypothetical protein